MCTAEMRDLEQRVAANNEWLRLSSEAAPPHWLLQSAAGALPGSPSNSDTRGEVGIKEALAKREQEIKSTHHQLLELQKERVEWGNVTAERDMLTRLVDHFETQLELQTLP